MVARGTSECVYMSRVIRICLCTVDFTSDGTPVAVASGNLWFVCSIGCNKCG